MSEHFPLQKYSYFNYLQIVTTVNQNESKINRLFAAENVQTLKFMHVCIKDVEGSRGLCVAILFY